MKHSRLFAATALALAFLLSGCGLKKDTKAAEAEVDRFHKRWNADEFRVVHDEAHMDFRKSQTANETAATLERVKRNLGGFRH